VTTLMIVAAVVTGLALGWCLTLTIALAAMSRSQARMQRKVRYWQAEAGRAQAAAGQLTHTAFEQLVAPEKW
jgi:outer membrane lipoprotein SlyB